MKKDEHRYKNPQKYQQTNFKKNKIPRNTFNQGREISLH